MGAAIGRRKDFSAEALRARWRDARKTGHRPEGSSPLRGTAPPVTTNFAMRSPAPGDSDVTSHFERESSNETKIAERSTRRAPETKRFPPDPSPRHSTPPSVDRTEGITTKARRPELSAHRSHQALSAFL